MPRQKPTQAELVTYTLGGNESPETWARLHIRVDDLLDISLGLSSRKAREFAIEVLTEQGSHLAYQPPNESMREDRSVRQFGIQVNKTGKPRWEHRRAVENIREQLRELKSRTSDEVFAWAIQEFK